MQESSHRNIATASPPISPILKAKIETLTDSYGEPSWTMPVVTGFLQAQAKAAVPSLTEMLKPSPPSEVEKWLTVLGTLVAGNMTEADAKSRLRAYKALLPAVCGALTRDSLERAGRKFKWFPSYAEIVEFLDAEKAEIEAQRDRAVKISLAPLDPPRIQPRPMSRWMSDLKASDPEKFAKLYPERVEG